MKYHLETIPVWDAFHLHDECPICAIYHKLEGEYLDTALGGAAMEPDIRLMTNELGFCQHHLEMLYAMRKRLPLALMLHTHLQEIEKDLAPAQDALIDPTAVKSGLFRRAPGEEESIQKLLETLNLTDRAHHLPNQLSGGQQQRVSIGRALMNAPAVVLADEPTGNLDSKNSQEIVELLKKSNREYGQTLIVITHDESIALQADRLLAIEDGHIVRDEVIR